MLITSGLRHIQYGKGYHLQNHDDIVVWTLNAAHTNIYGHETSYQKYIVTSS